MAVTTNYNWSTPDDTALVKDGAAAIRTLGSSIDTTTKALNPSTTLGDIEYRSSTANTNTRLGIGTTGQVLTVSGGVPAWATASSAAVLQVKNAKASAYQQVTSTSYVDLTNLSIAITPSSASNKVLVLVNVNGVAGGGGSNRARISLTDGSGTVLAVLNDYAVPTTTMVGYSLSFLDSPATTSSKTYKLMGLTDSGASFYVQNFQSVATTSTITVMEVTP